MGRVGEGELENVAGLEKAQGGWGKLDKASGAVDVPVGARAVGGRVPLGRLGLGSASALGAAALMLEVGGEILHRGLGGSETAGC